MGPANAGAVYLRSYLAGFEAYLERADVTDIYVNRPGELLIETLGCAIERHDAPGLDPTTLARVARQVAYFSHQAINREHPLLSASLPDGARIQIIASPATRGVLILAIRKHRAADLSLQDYVSAGAMGARRPVDPSTIDRSKPRLPDYSQKGCFLQRRWRQLARLPNSFDQV